MALCAPAAPGLWVSGGGLVRLPRETALRIGKECSFCKKPSVEAAAMAGTLGGAGRICDECVELSVEIMKEAGLQMGAAGEAGEAASVHASVTPEMEKAIRLLQMTPGELAEMMRFETGDVRCGMG